MMKFSVLEKLIQKYYIFDDILYYNWIIVIFLYSILTQRHELFMQTQWRYKMLKMSDNQIKDLMNILDLTWSWYLCELFCTLILNEVHQLYNVNLLQATIIFWLNAEFNLLLITTSLFNCIENFKELVLLFIFLKNDTLWEKLTVNSSVNLFELSDSDSVS